MKNFEEHKFIASDGINITYYTTGVPENFKAIVQIIHGMAEHARRYLEFANFLYDQGFFVILHDQRGHGKTGDDQGCLGFFSADQGWFRVVNDAFELATFFKNQYPDQALFLLGHSMGSIVARSLIISKPNFYAGALILGTTMGKNQLTIRGGRLIAKRESRKHGASTPSPKLTKMAFGSYNKNFTSERTPYDWLSENTDNVDFYMDDPHCGFDCSAGFFYDFFEGLLYVTTAANNKKISPSLPILILAGADDPVGSMGKEVERFFRLLKKSGCSHLSYQLYDNMRHEILMETKRMGVYLDISRFLDQCLTTKSVL